MSSVGARFEEEIRTDLNTGFPKCRDQAIYVYMCVCIYIYNIFIDIHWTSTGHTVLLSTKVVKIKITICGVSSADRDAVVRECHQMGTQSTASSTFYTMEQIGRVT
jgi:hypothetical protein